MEIFAWKVKTSEEMALLGMRSSEEMTLLGVRASEKIALWEEKSSEAMALLFVLFLGKVAKEKLSSRLVVLVVPEGFHSLAMVE